MQRWESEKPSQCRSGKSNAETERPEERLSRVGEGGDEAKKQLWQTTDP